VGFVSETTSPPRSADVKTKCLTPWRRLASISPSACASSEPFGPWTVTQNTPSICVLAFLKISSGTEGSPARSFTRGSNAARALALDDDVFRVKASISRGGSEGVERMAEMTEPPWVPVAPTMRKVRVAIINVVLTDLGMRCLIGMNELDCGMRTQLREVIELNRITTRLHLNPTVFGWAIIPVLRPQERD
jgi:hypothetical protein